MSAAVPGFEIAQRFVALLGGARVETASGEPCRVRPQTREEVGAVMRIASEERITVTPCGGGTALDEGRSVAPPRLLLDCSALNALLHYDAGDLTLGVQAGMRVRSIEALLAPERQMLPLDVAQRDRATVGGVLATAAHGPLRHAFGGVRDFCIGIEYVTADGVIARAGGNVVKNVAGYDLVKLLIGSYGTLAVITAANFKVFPEAGTYLTFSAEFSSAADAIRFAGRVRCSPLAPLAVELLSPRAQQYLSPERPVRDPDDFVPESPISSNDCWRVLVRATGSERVLDRYRLELRAMQADVTESASERELWDTIAELVPCFRAQHRNAMVLDIWSPLAHVAAIAERLDAIATDHGFLIAMQGRIAIGNIVAMLTPLSVDPPAAEHYRGCIEQLRAVLRDGATAFVRCAPEEAKRYLDVWGPSPTDHRASLIVKHAMDPDQLLNPGRFLL